MICFNPAELDRDLRILFYRFMILWCNRILCLVFLYVCISRNVIADQIFLKNGRTLDGLIKKETESLVVLDLGVGSTTIPRDRIDFIKRSDNKEKDRIRNKWRKKYFLHKKHVPKKLKNLAAEFRNLLGQRDNAVRAQQGLSYREGDEHGLRKEIKELHDRLIEVSRELKTFSPEQDLKGYNALVIESNALRAGMTLKHDELEKTKEGRVRATEQIASYRDSLTSFESVFSRQAEAYRHEREDERDSHFFARISERLDSLDGEFSKVIIQTTTSHGGTTVVTALVNDRVRGRFILDTGAVLVTISEAFAERLKLDMNARKEIQLVLADGRKISGGSVILSSLQMGDARVERVQAVVLPATVKEDVDGLLGMSFLKNFVVRLDGATGKLILKQFKPSG